MRWLAVLVVATGVAAAQPADLTKEFQAGVDAFRLGKLDEARAHLEKARAIDPKLPGPHRFIAAVAQAEGTWSECIDEARAALIANAASQEAPETRKLYESCRVSAGRTPAPAQLGDSAAIAVTTNVPGATVKIGGLVYGGTPLAPRPITAGTLDVEIEKAGWKPVTAQVIALPGIVTDYAVDLEVDPAAQSDAEAAAGGAKPTVGWLAWQGVAACNDCGPDGVGGWTRTLIVDGRVVGPTVPKPVEVTPGTHTVEIRTDGEPRADPWRRRVHIVAGQKLVLKPDLVDTDAREHTERIGLLLLGGGGALLATGFVAALVSQHAAADAREILRVETARDPANPGYDVEPMHTRADYDAARSRARSWAIASDLAFGAALATAGVGAYFLLKGERERTDVPPPFYVAPAPGGAVVGKGGAF